MPNKFRNIVLAAAGLVKEHFGIRAEIPSKISIREIDDIFADLVGKEPAGFKKNLVTSAAEMPTGELSGNNLLSRLKNKKTPSQNRSNSPAHT